MTQDFDIEEYPLEDFNSLRSTFLEFGRPEFVQFEGEDHQLTIGERFGLPLRARKGSLLGRETSKCTGWLRHHHKTPSCRAQWPNHRPFLAVQRFSRRP